MGKWANGKARAGLLLGVATLLAGCGQALGAGRGASGTTIVDISWPNCRAHVPRQAWGVVGATGGLNFRQNPCMASEASHFGRTELYANTGYPGVSYAVKYSAAPRKCSVHNERCLAYNYGFRAGWYAVTAAARQNVHSLQWWLDVETENSWTADTNANVAAITGTADGIRAAMALPVVKIGYYSYPGQWQTITGGWLNGAPAWAATGSARRADAIAACGQSSFTGGPVRLAQYVTALDQDYVCQ